MNKNLRKFMSFFGLVENQDKIDWLEWQNEQKRKLETGEEIEPPWVFAPNTEPWSGEWRQGSGEHWLLEIWLPFWHRLNERERENYLKKWQPPAEEWNEYLTVHWVK
jgi:hypothetical protein